MKIRQAKKIMKDGTSAYYRVRISRKLCASNKIPYWYVKGYKRDHRITKAIRLTRRKKKLI